MTAPTEGPTRLVGPNSPSSKGPWFRFSREIKLSDMISAGSLAIAAVTFVVAQCRNANVETQAYAESIRASAIGELETGRRVKHKTDQVFENAQVWASRAAQFPTDSVDAAVEFLYQSISRDRFDAIAAIRAERRAVAFAALYGHSPCASAAFDTTLTQLHIAADAALHELVDSATSIARRRVKSVTPESLRQELRASIRTQKSAFDQRADAIGGPLDSTLLSLIRSDDSAIVNGRNAHRAVACGRIVRSRTSPPTPYDIPLIVVLVLLAVLMFVGASIGSTWSPTTATVVRRGSILVAFVAIAAVHIITPTTNSILGAAPAIALAVIAFLVWSWRAGRF